MRTIDKNMKVVILASGFGTRISEESLMKPKPMINIGDKPILWHIMQTYAHNGFTDFVICRATKVISSKNISIIIFASLGCNL